MSAPRRLAALAVASLGWAGLVAPAAFSAPPDFAGFLSTREIGAEAWLAKNPRWDGRGVVIAVLDTGVDPSRPGLDARAGGGVKLIEARDFTGQGDVPLTRASLVDGKLHAGDLVVSGVETLAEKPLGKTGYWVGAFSEEALRHSAVEDIDGDGRSDSRFAIVAFQRADGEAVFVVDTDGDLDVSGEKVRRSFRDEPTTFVFGRAPRRRIAVAATVLPEERKVSLHFDDGAHGTHCAGIAAGFRLEGRDGFHGVAPGAEVMSLKIGHGGLSGGATVPGSMAEAIRFASRFAREARRPVVVSMSYGVGSETEGKADIDTLLTEELQSNPWLVAAVSAGNEGPGLSSLGTPAAATLAVAVAAMVTPKLAETLLGASGLKANKVFSFSSRGGELDKPDVLAPGVAWSTVPAFHEGAVMNGTSMAAPQVAGAMALLWSAALDQKLDITGGLVRRALRAGARPIAGASPLDQGSGLVDVAASWAALKSARGAREVAGFAVETPLPARPGETGSASYWRVGAGIAGLGGGIGKLGTGWQKVGFEVTPLVYGTVADDKVPGVFTTVSLESDSGWLEVDRRELGLKGDTPETVGVRIDLLRLASRPGIHVGRVVAREAGLWAFELPVVVIVPHTFRSAWAQTFAGKVVAGEVARVLVEVPPGASAMSATLSMSGEGALWLVPFDDAGRHVEAYTHRASEDERLTGRFSLGGEALSAGTWELCVVAPLKNTGAASFELEVAFAAIDGPAELETTVTAAGGATATLALRNRMDQPFGGALEAKVIGQTRARTLKVGRGKAALELEVAPSMSGVELELEVDEASWAKMTDFAFTVVDAGGAAVEQGAFGQRVARASWSVKPGVARRYQLELVAGLTHGDDEVEVVVREVQRYAAPAAWQVTPPRGMSGATLHAGVATTFSLAVERLEPLGGGFRRVSELGLVSRDGVVWQRWRLVHAR